MAITRAQQARQMLKTAGAVEQDGSLNFVKNSESVTVPKEFKARSNAPKVKLAYITDAEAKMLKKKKPGTPHKGPKGIPSYDSFGSIDASGKDTGVAGSQVSAAESGDFTGFQGTGGGPELPPGVQRKPSDEAQALRSAFIAAGGGQRVNPGFFDSRNVISPQELALAKAFNPTAFRKGRNQGILSFLGSGGLFGNLIRGIGQRLGLGKRFDEPTYDMRRFSGLGLFEPSENPNNLDIYNEFVDDEDGTTDIIIPKRKPDTLGLLEVPGIPLTPFQKDIKEMDKPEDFEKGLPQDVVDNLIAKLNTFETREYNNLLSGKELGLNTPEQNKRLEELQKKKDEEEASLINRAIVADGGMIGGGIMDAAGRQQYFLGKLVKKAKRAVKKIVKSPIGKIGLLAAGGFGLSKAGLLSKLYAGGKLTGMGKLALGAGISSLPLLFGQEEDEGQQLASMGSVGGNIDPRAYTDPYGVLYGAFKAEGGSMKDEPVAKRTMPLLDMGGQEMDLRAEGGFVPIGRMEKADDVPARLSKNEFVFTADAVRNAGDGDVDKGAEVMYNMMKNLEAGGEVSEESQGLEGARNMFQTSKRLEEVL
jgi:hypothetical protein